MLGFRVVLRALGCSGLGLGFRVWGRPFLLTRDLQHAYMQKHVISSVDAVVPILSWGVILKHDWKPIAIARN